ncbi:MAG: NAD-dependent epimerase/dehydratase family protein [Actinomycetota bacterium]|nr:MAG: NAD-dependent epimerase/dehydratase family protein [Actinomycetota bacterium]
MSKIVLVGASGNVGGAILSEAVARGHDVTAVTRGIAPFDAPAGVSSVTADVLDSEAVRSFAAGADVVISAYKAPHGAQQEPAAFLAAAKSLVAALRELGDAAPRLIVVGGAGSLEVAPGVSLLDSGGIPEQFREWAGGHVAELDYLRTVQDVDWAYLSPSPGFGPGERTANFRVGGDALLVGADGKSAISVPDYAVAIIDEVEQQRHSRQRFTVGY